MTEENDVQVAELASDLNRELEAQHICDDIIDKMRLENSRLRSMLQQEVKWCQGWAISYGIKGDSNKSRIFREHSNMLIDSI